MPTIGCAGLAPIVDVCKMKMRIVVLITDMELPAGRAVGNAPESGSASNSCTATLRRISKRSRSRSRLT